MQPTLRIALIYGSTREGRLCDTVAGWVSGELETRSDFIVEVIDPATLDLPGRIERDESPAADALGARIAAADGFIVVTPEYNHGYPAPLKHVIDLFDAEWHAKPVAFVSYGGASGGLRAVEQLRLVFAELHAVTLRDSVSFASVWEQFDPTGGLSEPARARRALGTMLDSLRWWGEALRAARDATPYRMAA